MCECCFPNFWAVCVTLISQHMGKKGEGLRIQILDLTWPPLPRSPHRRNPLISALNNNNTCTAQVTTHLVTHPPDSMILHSGISDKILLFWQHSYNGPSNDISFLHWKLRTESCPACEKKEMSKWPRFQVSSQVSCPPFYPHGNGGSGDWPSSNQSPLFCHCYSSCVLWQENILTELTYSCREANHEYRKESL